MFVTNYGAFVDPALRLLTMTRDYALRLAQQRKLFMKELGELAAQYPEAVGIACLDTAVKPLQRKVDELKVEYERVKRTGRGWEETVSFGFFFYFF